MEHEQPQIPVVQVAICKSGPQYFWCVVDEDAREVVAFGREETLEEAEEQVWAQSRIHRPRHRAIQVASTYAEYVRRTTWRLEHYSPTGVFVYEHWYDQLEGHWDSLPHEIVKQTERFITVRDPFGYVFTRLDRKVLERDGKVYHKRTRHWYFSQASEVEYQAELAKNEGPAE